MPDVLTGLLTRHEFLYEVAAQGLSSRSIAVLYCDIDRMKLTNAIVGHTDGDRIINEVGRRVAECAGRQSVVARSGGDEFVVALFDTVAIGACRVGEAIMASVLRSPTITADPPHQCSAREYELAGADERQSQRWILCQFYGPLADGTYVVSLGNTTPPMVALAGPLETPFPISGLHTSISVGVAVGGAAPFDLDRLIDAADVAMFTAKQNGRSQIAVAATS